MEIDMSTPKRIQRKRTKGFNLQEYSKQLNGLPCVYVGRNASGPGEYGNPFKIGGLYKVGKGGNGTFIWMHCYSDEHNDGSYTRVATLAQSLEMYQTMIANYPPSKKKLDALRGKNLACWCAEDAQCHADILLELANRSSC
jgi:hypothetical protein